MFLAIPFCPYHFVRAILSNTILSVYHFVRYHFVLEPLHVYLLLSGRGCFHAWPIKMRKINNGYGKCAAESPTVYPFLIETALVRRCIEVLAPPYLRELYFPSVPIQRCISFCILRSSAQVQLLVPRTWTVRQRRAFSVAGPIAWTGLPVALRRTPMCHSALFCPVLAEGSKLQNPETPENAKAVCCIAFWNNVKQLNIICMTLIAISRVLKLMLKQRRLHMGGKEAAASSLS